MATSTPPPPPPPPIQTTTTTTNNASTTSPTSNSDGSSTITPSLSTTAKLSKTPFSPFPPTPDYEDDVHSPSLSSGNALARFEFERLDAEDGRDIGTKVLMVEWADDESTAHITGEWSLGWEGMSVAAQVPVAAQSADKRAATLAVADAGKEAARELHRLYFLLPHWQRVPGTVVLTLVPQSPAQASVTWRTHPLPAIYPPALGNSARASGKRGVLHTIWAKKRLQSLASEIHNEELNNPEGVSLSLAIQERDWIEQNFGVVTKPQHAHSSTDLCQPRNNSTSTNPSLPSPSSPRSPGRGPLLEKLKGLRLATGDTDLKAASPLSTTTTSTSTQQDQTPAEHNPLSPETADVAVSWPTFASLNNMSSNPRDTLAAKPAQRPTSSSQTPTQVPPMRTIAPPSSIINQQREELGQGTSNIMASLNAFTVPAQSSSEIQFRRPAASGPATGGGEEEGNEGVNEEEDLFALPISPRSPDRGGDGAAGGGGAKKFTFGDEDTGRYVSPCSASK